MACLSGLACLGLLCDYVYHAKVDSSLHLSTIERNASLAAITRFVNFPLLALLALGILTLLRDLLSPVDSLAKLVAPCIAWGIIFLATATFIPFQVWRGNLGAASKSRWIGRTEANIIICLLLAHLCSASAHGFSESLWPCVCSF